MLLLTLLLACGDKESATDDTSIGDTAAESIDTSMDQYKMVYCEEYAMRCGVYASVEECEAEFNTWFSAECEITDKETFDVCADWLFSLDCSVEGWIDECDQFYTCP